MFQPSVAKRDYSQTLKKHQHNRITKMLDATHLELTDAIKRKNGVRSSVTIMYGTKDTEQLIENWERCFDNEINPLLERKNRLETLVAKLEEEVKQNQRTPSHTCRT